jgi:dihydrofolate reductase
MYNDERGIGLNNAIPWNLPVDMNYFQMMTTSVPAEVLAKKPLAFNAVIMGSNTFRSLGGKPLLRRMNVVLTRDVMGHIKDPKTLVMSSEVPLEDVIEYVATFPNVHNIFVCGGSFVYKKALVLPTCRNVYLTRIYDSEESKAKTERKFDCFMPEFEDQFIRKSSVPHELTGVRMTFDHYQRESEEERKRRVNPEEMQYLDLLRDVISNGTVQPNRTGTDCRVQFGRQLRFDLSKHFPLITTKKVNLNNILLELFWFLEGNTNALTLAERGCKIWLDNTTQEEYDKRARAAEKLGEIGLAHYWSTRKVGDCGPVQVFSKCVVLILR